MVGLYGAVHLVHHHYETVEVVVYVLDGEGGGRVRPGVGCYSGHERSELMSAWVGRVGENGTFEDPH